MKIKLLLIAFALLIPLAAQDLTLDIAGLEDMDMDNFDEDALFSSSNAVIDMEEIEDDSVLDDEESTGFEGSISSSLSFGVDRDLFYDGPAEGESFMDYHELGASISGNFTFDARLLKGFKTVLKFGVNYNPFRSYKQSNALSSLISISEFFADININRKVYFKLGKQRLSWGRTSYFSPVDLINIEKVDFNDMDAVLSGTYGIKMHIPFGTKFNIYSFIKFGNEPSIEDLAYALKLEALLFDKIEAAISAWGKQHNHPVFGLEFSGRIPGVNIQYAGETAFFYKGNKTLVRYYESPTNYESYSRDSFFPRMALSMSKSLDGRDDPGRYGLSAAVMFNGDGYEGEDNFLNSEEEIEFMTVSNSFYSADYHSRVYGTASFSMRDFIAEDLRMSLSTLVNFSDLSGRVSLGLSYSQISRFAFGATVSTAFGDRYDEYTFRSDGVSTRLRASYSF